MGSSYCFACFKFERVLDENEASIEVFGSREFDVSSILLTAMHGAFAVCAFFAYS